MPQPFSQQPQFKTRMALLLFIKGSAAPMVLYFENPQEVYEELTQVLKTSSATAKLIEKEAIGPIKKFSVLSNQISAIGMQEEQYM